jgi:hypothetical protein
MSRLHRLIFGVTILWAACMARADTEATEPRRSDPDGIARYQLDRARVDLQAGHASRVMRRLSTVFALEGVSELYRAKSMALTVDLSLRRGDWKLARRCAEWVLNSTSADSKDRDYCQSVLRELRQDHPEVFP